MCVGRDAPLDYSVYSLPRLTLSQLSTWFTTIPTSDLRDFDKENPRHLHLYKKLSSPQRCVIDAALGFRGLEARLRTTGAIEKHQSGEMGKADSGREGLAKTSCNRRLDVDQSKVYCFGNCNVKGGEGLSRHVFLNNRDKLSSLLRSIEYPVLYLDFETMNSCVPQYPGMKPYARAFVQYSAHVCENEQQLLLSRDDYVQGAEGGGQGEGGGGEGGGGRGEGGRRGGVTHYGYLGECREDCREDVARSLAQLVERWEGSSQERGSVIVYNQSFEKGVIKELIDLFPHLARKLGVLLDPGRMVDLLDVVRGSGVMAPGMRGSTSLKAVMRELFFPKSAIGEREQVDEEMKDSNSLSSPSSSLVLAREPIEGVAYVDQNVADGLSASLLFVKRAAGTMGDEEWEVVRQELEEYCKQDTLSLVMLHRELLRLSRSETP